MYEYTQAVKLCVNSIQYYSKVHRTIYLKATSLINIVTSVCIYVFTHM